MISQPPFNGIRRPSTKSESRNKLRKLQFDPIEKLVNLYEKLEAENEFYLQLRDRIGVTELDENGNELRKIRYSYVGHTAVLSQLEKVSSQLLRYRYARVPETVNIDSEHIPMLNITLEGITKDDDS
jgi:hypothetical protein